ncbi:flavodoxin [Nostoc sp.]|uniref:flavodoxin n=1 Tax=Nostoc sp. TaxID=1180 RepID=UPI002FF54534
MKNQFKQQSEKLNRRDFIIKFSLAGAGVTLGSVAFLASCNLNKTEATKTLVKENILTVYITRTGNTEAIAKMIQANVGGNLISLELENPYPQDYQAIVKQVDQENEKGYLPPLKTKIDNIQKYQTIFIGFPTWDMQLPPPMKSFLNEYDLSGKTVIPFNTNAGYGTGSSFQQVKQLCPNSTILEDFEIKGGIERDGILFVMEGEKEEEARMKVKQWLQKIGITKNHKDTFKAI